MRPSVCYNSRRSWKFQRSDRRLPGRSQILDVACWPLADQSRHGAPRQLLTQCMVRPWGARRFRRSGRCGLASMYPASVWSAVLRAIMDISAHVIWLADRPRPGHLGHQGSHVPGRPILHRRLILSQTSAGKGCYVIDSSSLRAVPSFVPGGRSFVPACARRRAARKGPSKPAVVLS